MMKLSKIVIFLLCSVVLEVNSQDPVDSAIESLSRTANLKDGISFYQRVERNDGHWCGFSIRSYTPSFVPEKYYFEEFLCKNLVYCNEEKYAKIGIDKKTAIEVLNVMERLPKPYSKDYSLQYLMAALFAEILVEYRENSSLESLNNNLKRFTKCIVTLERTGSFSRYGYGSSRVSSSPNDYNFWMQSVLWEVFKEDRLELESILFQVADQKMELMYKIDKYHILNFERECRQNKKYRIIRTNQTNRMFPFLKLSPKDKALLDHLHNDPYLEIKNND